MFASQRAHARRVALLVVSLVGAFSLAACGGDSAGSGHSGGTSGGHSGSSVPAKPRDVNDADVMFAQMMIPHHQQAVDMAKDAGTKATDPKVKKLAASIAGAQAPEIKQMSGWLSAWGKPAPAGADHSAHGGAGMMSPEDMDKLRRARGAEFDKMFLQMMIKHHEGAITMARDEQASGQHPQAKALAKQIETTQKTEIALMRRLLAS